MSIIDIEHASFSYDGKTEIFSDLSYTISSDEVFCILGPNGIGKSTLLKAMFNLLPLKAGCIKLDGVDIRQIPPAKMAKKMAFIPQSHQLVFPYRVLDIVLMGRTPHLNKMVKPSKEDYDIAMDAISSLHLEDLIYRPCNQLSGGQLQLVMLARTLAQGADFLVLDEPTSHLDFGKQMQTLDIIATMKKKQVGIIMTSHYPDHTFLVCDRVAIMGERRFIAVGTPDDVVTEENLSDIYGIDIRVVMQGDGINRKVCIPVPHVETEEAH